MVLKRSKQMKMLMAMWCVVLGIGVAGADTVTFQQNVNGYAGTADAMIEGAASYWGYCYNYGGTKTMWCRGTPSADGFEQAVLIRFDDIFGPGKIDISRAADIASAKLKLYCTSDFTDGGGSYNILVRAMNTSWVEGNTDGDTETGAVTYGYRGYSNQYWGTNGIVEDGPAAGVDLANGIECWPSQPVVGQWLVVDIRNVIRLWAKNHLGENGGLANNGLYLIVNGDKWRGAQFASSENDTVAQRPELEVEYTYDPIPQTNVTFQQDVNSYAGTADAMIEGAASYWGYCNNYGASKTMWCRGTPSTDGFEQAVLIRFDDIFGPGKIDAYRAAGISSAKLKLYCTEDFQDNGSYNILVRAMNTSWVEGNTDGDTEMGAVTYGYRGYSDQYWGTNGIVEDGPAAGIDFDDNMQVWPGQPVVGQWQVVDISEIVRLWAKSYLGENGGLANNGLYLIVNADKWRGGQFASSENDTVAQRPVLDVQYASEPLIHQNQAFDVPAIGSIATDGNLNDWPSSTLWSEEYITWHGDGLSSHTKAKFAWNDAGDILYVAIRTNQANGGHAVIGISSNVDATAWSASGDATQLAFDIVGGSVVVMNEIDSYSSGSFAHKTTGVTAGAVLGTDGYYIYEIAIPVWTNWVTPGTKVSLTAERSTLYIYSMMEDVYAGANGTDLTYDGNPNFSGPGGFSYASVLTLKKGMIPGDANNDGAVDVGDLGILAANYGGSGKLWNQGDFNGDGFVDVGDLGILAAHYGEGSVNPTNFDADYAKAFGTTVADDTENDSTPGSSVCNTLGLPLVAGLMLAGLMLMTSSKLEE
jgi:hypothetical protein